MRLPHTPPRNVASSDDSGFGGINGLASPMDHDHSGGASASAYGSHKFEFNSAFNAIANSSPSSSTAAATPAGLQSFIAPDESSSAAVAAHYHKLNMMLTSQNRELSIRLNQMTHQNTQLQVALVKVAHRPAKPSSTVAMTSAAVSPLGVTSSPQIFFSSRTPHRPFPNACTNQERVGSEWPLIQFRRHSDGSLILIGARARHLRCSPEAVLGPLAPRLCYIFTPPDTQITSPTAAPEQTCIPRRRARPLTGDRSACLCQSRSPSTVIAFSPLRSRIISHFQICWSHVLYTRRCTISYLSNRRQLALPACRAMQNSCPFRPQSTNEKASKRNTGSDHDDRRTTVVAIITFSHPLLSCVHSLA